MSRSPIHVRARNTLPLALALALGACATQKPPAPRAAAAPPATPAVTPAPAAPVPASTGPITVTTPLPAPRHPTAEVRARFVREAVAKYGLDPAQVESVLARAQLRESTVTAMARPAEAKPWRDYRPIFVTPQRIEGGRAFLAQHRDALAKVEAQYGVPAEIIVAILGVETSWGRNTGNAPVLDALYTLAFNYPRTNLPDKIERENQREAFFRDELAQLVALGRDTGMDVATLTGSYAGAMGWGQFMPSSYRLYAVDGDGDGKRDLFTDLDDVFASVANYFVRKGGWERGRPVMVRADYVPGTLALVDSKGEPIHDLATLAQAGYKPQSPLPPGITGAPIVLDGVSGNEHWLTFRNFRAIWSYNNSIRYATAVYQLAEAIAGREVAGAPEESTDASASGSAGVPPGIPAGIPASPAPGPAGA
ncbi:lytic murein transglycosylase B [Lysobacter solisilvae]|uniref:Lytic murein transglycosylase B n=1 Tax=Agrilutibacter solisilvae TaxID=2763317 RepID=A0A974XZV9_9GAMM|nr:lytic murein transglycosylase B [Lysobacter solisilvae]QSX78749.1 lytic murein transglycosylase B [Lysobacter solisilvae]